MTRLSSPVWPSSPWENLDRLQAPPAAAWMPDQWPASASDGLSVPPSVEDLLALEKPWSERVGACLLLEAFWHAWDHAQGCPEQSVQWAVDYDTLDAQETPDLSFTAISEPLLVCRALPSHVSLLPEHWPHAYLVQAAQSFGVDMVSHDWKTGVVLTAEQDLKSVLKQCFGPAYARWWEHHHLTQSLPSAPSSRLRSRM